MLISAGAVLAGGRGANHAHHAAAAAISRAAAPNHSGTRLEADDGLVGWGTPAQIERFVRAHLDAGATQVCVQFVNPNGQNAGLHWEAVDDWSALTTALPTPRRWLFTKRAQRAFWDADFRPGDAMVFGSESAGLPESLQEQHPDQLLRIPTSDDVRSLNLSNAVAVAVYEALRQWQQNGE